MSLVVIECLLSAGHGSRYTGDYTEQQVALPFSNTLQVVGNYKYIKEEMIPNVSSEHCRKEKVEQEEELGI